MAAVQEAYAAEVKGAKDRLKRLKDRYNKRVTVRRVGPAGPAAQVKAILKNWKCQHHAMALQSHIKLNEERCL